MNMDQGGRFWGRTGGGWWNQGKIVLFYVTLNTGKHLCLSPSLFRLPLCEKIGSAYSVREERESYTHYSFFR